MPRRRGEIGVPDIGQHRARAVVDDQGRQGGARVEGGSLAARLLYPSVRHEAPEKLPVSPVIGTDALPNHPFDPAAPAVSANVPIIVSTTLEDAALGLTQPQLVAAASMIAGGVWLLMLRRGRVTAPAPRAA